MAFPATEAVANPSNGGELSVTEVGCFPADCVGVAHLDWGLGIEESILVTKFDSSLGTLTGVEVAFEARYIVAVCAENVGAGCTPGEISRLFSAHFDAAASNDPPINGLGSLLITEQAQITPPGFMLGPTNGTLDCQTPTGPMSDGTCSGGDFVGANIDVVLAAPRRLLTEPSGLTAWVAGVGHNQVEFSGWAQSLIAVNGGGNMYNSFEQAASASIEVTYVYIPAETGSGYCFGDGTQGTCPCGAMGVAGQGCPNTNANGSGALLQGAGSATLGNDSFCLTMQDAPFNKPGILFQGSQAQNYPNGNNTLANASGLLCVVPAIRGDVFFSSASGEALAGDFQGQPFGATAQPPGSTTYYQYWFRDTGNPCQNAPASSAAFNFSNAVEVDWRP